MQHADPTGQDGCCRDDRSPRNVGGCYGIQVLIAGRQKHWRDGVSAEVRRAGYATTTVDSALDALTVLVLGLPVDILLTDLDLDGQIDGATLTVEARALRPNLRIILARDVPGANVALDSPPALCDGPLRMAEIVREAVAARAT